MSNETEYGNIKPARSGFSLTEWENLSKEGKANFSRFLITMLLICSKVRVDFLKTPGVIYCMPMTMDLETGLSSFLWKDDVLDYVRKNISLSNEVATWRSAVMTKTEVSDIREIFEIREARATESEYAIQFALNTARHFTSADVAAFEETLPLLSNYLSDLPAGESRVPLALAVARFKTDGKSIVADHDAAPASFDRPLMALVFPFSGRFLTERGLTGRGQLPCYYYFEEENGKEKIMLALPENLHKVPVSK